MELLYKKGVYDLIGAAIEVYNVLGPGFLEPVYQEAFEIELRCRGTPFVSHPELHIYFKEHLLKKTYTPDFLAYEKIVLEIKALERLTSHDEAQLLNYLKATRLELGVLINFGAADKLEWKRMVKTHESLAKGSTA